MTGMEMMLKAAGFNPSEIMAQVEALKTELPLFAAHIKQKVDSTESRIDAIETGISNINNKLDRILEAVEKPEPAHGA